MFINVLLTFFLLIIVLTPGFLLNYSCSIFVYVPIPDEGVCMMKIRIWFSFFPWGILMLFTILHILSDPLSYIIILVQHLMISRLDSLCSLYPSDHSFHNIITANIFKRVSESPKLTIYERASQIIHEILIINYNTLDV